MDERPGWNHDGGVVGRCPHPFPHAEESADRSVDMLDPPTEAAHLGSFLVRFVVPAPGSESVQLDRKLVDRIVELRELAKRAVSSSRLTGSERLKETN